MKISRKIKLLILLLMCSSIFFIYNKTNNNNINYTSLGDGLAKGIDCYGQIDYGYSDYVKEYLQEKNKLKVYSKDYTGQDMTIERLTNTILTNKKVNRNNKKTNIKTILRETDYLTISIGMNDLLYRLDNSAKLNNDTLNKVIKEIEESFNELITEIKKVYQKEIYVIGYYQTKKENDYLNKAINKLNDIYMKNENITYISTKTISKNKELFLPNPNSYYPNYKGYQVISTKIINKISKKLEKS